MSDHRQLIEALLRQQHQPYGIGGLFSVLARALAIEDAPAALIEETAQLAQRMVNTVEELLTTTPERLAEMEAECWAETADSGIRNRRRRR